MINPIDLNHLPPDILRAQNNSTEQIQKIHLIALSILFIISSFLLFSNEIALSISIGITLLALTYITIQSIFKENTPPPPYNHPISNPATAITPYRTSSPERSFFNYPMPPFHYYQAAMMANFNHPYAFPFNAFPPPPYFFPNPEAPIPQIHPSMLQLRSSPENSQYEENVNPSKISLTIDQSNEEKFRSQLKQSYLQEQRSMNEASANDTAIPEHFGCPCFPPQETLNTQAPQNRHQTSPRNPSYNSSNLEDESTLAGVPSITNSSQSSSPILTSFHPPHPENLENPFLNSISDYPQAQMAPDYKSRVQHFM